MTDSLRLVIWGREFILPVQYDCYRGESVTEEQVMALRDFASHTGVLDSAKARVETYCRERLMKDNTNQKKDNIFSYVKPECLFVKHERTPRIALMCNYRYDLEHGLAVVVSKDGSIDIGTQDIIL